MTRNNKLPKVLFRHCEDWEHLIVHNDGFILSDGVENHKLTALEVLEELARIGIVKLKVEQIEDEDD